MTLFVFFPFNFQVCSYKIVIVDAGDDKEPGPGSLYGFEFISTSPSPCEMGCYKCNWTIVNRLGPRFANEVSPASAACFGWSHG